MKRITKVRALYTNRGIGIVIAVYRDNPGIYHCRQYVYTQARLDRLICLISQWEFYDIQPHSLSWYAPK
jgi:hypothetical protein